MSKAIVIWADGSKEMAHNLDDQIFRWHERKIAQAQEVQEQVKRGITIRDCSNPKDVDQARYWKDELTVQQMALQQYQHILEQRSYRDKGSYNRAVAPFKAAITEIIAQHAVLKRYLRAEDGSVGRLYRLECRVDELEQQLRVALETIEQLKGGAA